MLPLRWAATLPFHRLPLYVDFRFTGAAVSTLQSLAALCQADADVLDAAERASALELAAAKEALLLRLVVPVL